MGETEATAKRGELLWEPSAESVERSTMTRYMRWLADERGLEFGDYESLWRWSASDIEDFWASIWDFFEVEASAPYSEVLRDHAMPGANWFPGALLSYPQHIFRNRNDADVAVRHASELRDLGELTWASSGTRSPAPPRASASWASAA